LCGSSFCSFQTIESFLFQTEEQTQNSGVEQKASAFLKSKIWGLLSIV